MSFYQEAKVNDMWEVDPVAWGNFKIIGLEESYPKNNFVAACYCKLKNKKWYNLIRGILTNNIDLVKENIDKIDILKTFPVITNDPNESIKFFSVKEAKKYSNREIQDLIREKYNAKLLNSNFCSKQTKARESRGSYFETIPSFDEERLVKIKSDQFKAFAEPIFLKNFYIIGVPTDSSAYPPDTSANFEYAVRLNSNLMCAVISGNLDLVKNIVQSAPDISLVCTRPSFITENFNKLNIDLPFEAEQLGFTQIAEYLKYVEKIQKKYFGIPFGNCTKLETSALEEQLGTFVNAGTAMEIEN